MLSEEKQREYDEKIEQVHKLYSKIRLRIRLIWLGYNVIAIAGLIFLATKWDVAFSVAIIIFNLLASFTIEQTRLKFWKRAEERQKDAIREQIPMGSFKF